MYYTIKDLNKLSPRLAKEIAQQQGTQRQWHPSYNDITHPRCDTPGCRNPKIVMDWHWTSGKPVYRSVCNSCHHDTTAKRYSVKNPGAEWVKTVADVVAHKQGFTSLAEYSNSKHPYRRYRKDYCENRDGRLGFKCTTTIVWDGQLDVDHKDEDPSNNRPSNLQTLCKCCHAYKGNEFVKLHGQTPGRKSLGITR